MLVKICGIKTDEAAHAVEQGNADFMGMIFVKGRSRYVEPELAKKIAAKYKNVKKVGVFLDDSPEWVNETAAFVGIDYVQLHGHESPEYAKHIHFPIIKAFRWNDDFDVTAINSYPCSIALIDSFNKRTNGGTGESFDWCEAAEEIKRIKKPVLIAGGISEENISMLKKIMPFDNVGVDASSSLEINNCKSVKKIHAFLHKVKELEQEGK